MCHTVSASSTAVQRSSSDMPKRGLRSYDVCVTIYSNLTRLLLHEQQHSHLGLGWAGLAWGRLILSYEGPPPRLPRF